MLFLNTCNRFSLENIHVCVRRSVLTCETSRCYCSTVSQMLKGGAHGCVYTACCDNNDNNFQECLNNNNKCFQLCSSRSKACNSLNFMCVKYNMPKDCGSLQQHICDISQRVHSVMNNNIDNYIISASIIAEMCSVRDRRDFSVLSLLEICDIINYFVY